MTQVTKRVALFCAIETELLPLIRQLGLRNTTVGRLDVFRGRMGAVDIIAFMTNMGRESARVAASRLFELEQRLPIDHAMVVGIAGGMGTSKKHDVVAPLSILDKHSGETFHSSAISKTLRVGHLLTQDGVGLNQEEFGRFSFEGFLALDMETSAIARVCKDASISFEVFRGISDFVCETPAQVERLAKQNGRPNIPAVLRYLRKNPGSLPSLLQLGWNAHRAAHLAARKAASALWTMQ
jgi:adenosylhomocysteine nucleosidase